MQVKISLVNLINTSIMIGYDIFKFQEESDFERFHILQFLKNSDKILTADYQPIKWLRKSVD